MPYPDAHWGSGHQHNDKLHLSVSAYGRDFLVDAGRFAYTGEVAEKFRPYAKGTQGHNLILIDGMGQAPGPTHSTEAIEKVHYKITDDLDYASHSFDQFVDLEGTAEHVRTLFYVRGAFWVVVDKVITDQPRKIETLWHWHPDSEIVHTQQWAKTENTKGNLAIIPVGSKTDFDIRLIKGQEYPEIQGWYSPEYNLYEPNTTTVYAKEIQKTSTLVWVLMPSAQETPDVETSILSEDENDIRIEIKYMGKSWELSIPFLDSSRTELLSN